MSREKKQAKHTRVLTSEGARSIDNPVVRWMREKLVTLILAGIMLVGIGLLVYPSFADYWNSFHQSRAVMSYAEAVSRLNEEEYGRILEDARTYNADLGESGINWAMPEDQKEKYRNTLDIGGDGVMGYIRIRKIDVMLPVYHGTDENVLLTSIGHLQETSLPVGGESSHCVLSGHRGLPSARLFTDLDKLVAGDTFTLTVLNETLTYEVDHIWIVEPEDLSHLVIENGKDYCTLVTCTPYGVNTHRLLVRGHRIDNADGDAMVIADAIQIRPVFIAPLLSIPLLIVLLIYVLISTSAKNRKRRDYKDEYMKENNLAEVVIESEEQEDILDAIRNYWNKRNGTNKRG